MGKSKKKSEFRELLLPLIAPYLKGQLGLLVVGIFAGAVAAILAGFGLPFIVQNIFPIVFEPDNAPLWLQESLASFGNPGEEQNHLLWAMAFILPLLMLARGTASFFNTYILTLVGVRAAARLRVNIFARLQSLSFSFHDASNRGKLMATVIQLTQRLQQSAVAISNDLVIQPLTLIAAMSYLIYAAMSNDQSAILLGNLLATFLSIPIVRMVGSRVAKHMKKSLAGMMEMSANIEESLSTQREIRAFNLQGKKQDELYASMTLMNRASFRLSCWQHGISPSVEILCALALSFSLYRGCSNGLTLEQFTAIAVAFFYCYDPIKRLGTMSTHIRMIMEVAKALNLVIQAKDETPEPSAEKARSFKSRPRGEVVFKHVNFAYSADKPVLHDISISVPEGQVIALVGPSGSGKTTFINLICRFYDVCSGSISIDGIDVRDLRREERTRYIALVSQFAALFRDSIWENIRVGRVDASDADILLAAKRAYVDEFVESSSEGYDKLLDEGGSGLSGGQRQRVSIARAFLKNAPILILDEATSALDMKSEALVQKSLEELAQGHTTFVIAHRFSTIRMAQRILVFDEGRIVADGAHEDLYESCSLYRRLYNDQSRKANSIKDTHSSDTTSTLNMESQLKKDTSYA